MFIICLGESVWIITFYRDPDGKYKKKHKPHYKATKGKNQQKPNESAEWNLRVSFLTM